MSGKGTEMKGKLDDHWRSPALSIQVEIPADGWEPGDLLLLRCQADAKNRDIYEDENFPLI